MARKVNNESLLSVCEREGVTYATVYKRIRQGESLEKAIKHARRAKRGAPIKYKVNGVPLIKYCKEKGIHYHKIVQRILRGKTLKEALNEK